MRSDRFEVRPGAVGQCPQALAFDAAGEGVGVAAAMPVDDVDALALVDAWTFHYTGSDSDVQISSKDYILNGSYGKPVQFVGVRVFVP